MGLRWEPRSIFSPALLQPTCWEPASGPGVCLSRRSCLGSVADALCVSGLPGSQPLGSTEIDEGWAEPPLQRLPFVQSHFSECVLKMVLLLDLIPFLSWKCWCKSKFMAYGGLEGVLVTRCLMKLHQLGMWKLGSGFCFIGVSVSYHCCLLQMMAFLEIFPP